MKTKICFYCGNSFLAHHGNSNYCPDKDCAYKAKKQRSINQYAIKSKQADPFWNNEKILRESYHAFGPQKEIDPNGLETIGFDFDLSSEEKNVDGTLIFCMRNFGYSFLKNQNILIWKIR